LKRAALPLAVAVLVLSPVAAAPAAQRYAAPDGTGGEPCAQAAPCSLKDALTKANEGDEVTVGAGAYSVGEQPIFPSAENLNVHGDLGGPMPKIVATSMSAPLFLLKTGDRVSYLEVVNTHFDAGGFLCGPKGRIERVLAVVSGESATGVSVTSDCVARDALVIADGENAAAIRGDGVNVTGVVRNVTAIATGSGSIGAGSYYGETITPGTYTLDLKNTIVSGESADLVAHSGEGFDGPGNIVVSNSSFDHPEQKGTGTVTEGSGNQKAAPLFVASANGDYREATGSPTIDAGVNDQLGATDLAGNPRVLGAAPDIGAFEFLPPPVAAAGGVRSLSIKPKRFRARRAGGPVAAGILKSKPPVGTEVTYTMSGDRTVEFSVARRVQGRKVSKLCKRKSHVNAAHKKCAFYVPVKGLFTQPGTVGSNHFVFSGRIGGKKLKPGGYKLSALAGHLISEAFTIVG
jgi:hypothetical protein